MFSLSFCLSVCLGLADTFYSIFSAFVFSTMCIFLLSTTLTSSYTFSYAMFFIDFKLYYFILFIVMFSLTHRLLVTVFLIFKHMESHGKIPYFFLFAFIGRVRFVKLMLRNFTCYEVNNFYIFFILSDDKHFEKYCLSPDTTVLSCIFCMISWRSKKSIPCLF